MRWIALLALLWSSAYAAETMSIATGSPAGLYYPFGGGLASIWSKARPDINIKAEVTGASVVNIIQVAKGESELGISQGDALREAINGEGKYPYPMPVRALFALYPNIVHAIALEDAGIASIDDFKGKRVSVGAPGSGTAITSLRLLETLGLTTDMYDVQYLSYTETTDGLKNGTLDAGFLVGGLGLAAVVELALTRDMMLIPFSDEEMQKISAQWPAYTPFDVPTNSYQGVKEPVQTVSLWNFLIVHKDMPDDEAVWLTTKALLNQKFLMGVTKSARFMTPDNSLKYGQGILHPAAERLFNAPFPRPKSTGADATPAKGMGEGL
tara:strand:- start:744 stop:1718 length:975 start_codon:yes stop_codon:yes gene_type:complete